MNADERQARIKLAETLDTVIPEKINALIGFDGFIDEIVHVVDKRINIENYERLTSMSEYGRRIERSTGLSTNVEMVTVDQKLGGNGPIFANALIEYGFNITYMGALGVPDIHPIFKEMVSRCQAIPLANPARTDAIEFFDGKIISSKLESLKEISWNNIKNIVGINRIIKMLEECQVVGFENWTMVHYMSDIWKHMISEVLPRLKKKNKKPIIFFDLADPEKRRKEDILEALELIGEFKKNYYTVLGLNKKEACEIAQIMEMPVRNFDEQDLKTMAQYIYSKVDLDVLTIHPVKEACAISTEGFCRVSGPYCQCPKLTTGAGDNFNAGFIFGITMEFPINDALLLGTATSGYYVRNTVSPNLQQVREFLKIWAEDRLESVKM